ncbi:hypothetical protein DFS34DRAFT_651963 [Phlyctochytrium arcticum]|nr:hypothetical protein DFS34DRAFT_651963 [Phlyctochytrium arcticum]
MAAASILGQNVGPSLGYFPGDLNYIQNKNPSQTRGQGQRDATTVIVSALDIKRLRREIDGAGVEERIREMQRLDRERRGNLSKKRVARWDNTIAGQRRQRLQAREERLAKEEEERVRQDVAYAEEEAARRQGAIDRAKQILYCQTDMVKNFHSKVMLYEALKERDMQLGVKLERKAIEKNLDSQLQKEIQKQNQIAHEEELRNLAAQRLRNLEQFQDLQHQHKDKLAQEAMEIEENVREGERLAQLGEDVREEKRQAAAKIKAQRSAMREELLEMRRALAIQQETDRILDEEEQGKALRWADRKRHQATVKKEVEKARFEESQKSRQTMGEQNAREDAAIDAKLDEVVARAMLEREEKALRQEAYAAALKKKRAEEVLTAYEEHVQQSKVQRQQQKEKDEEELRDYLQIHEKTVAARQARKEELLRIGKDLQMNHLVDMAAHSVAKAREREMQLKHDQEMMSSLDQESSKLHAYMRSVAAEPWAKDNARLQTHVHEETSRSKNHRPWRLADKYILDTGRRLGLTNTKSYHPIDLATTNEIGRGDFLTIVGKGPVQSTRSLANTNGVVVTKPVPTSAPNSRPQSSSTIVPQKGKVVSSLPALPDKSKHFA